MSPRREPQSPEEFERAATAPPGHAVGPAINEYLQRNGFSKVVQFGAVLDAWEAAVGANVALHCRPLRVERDELVVEVDHQGWLTELTFRSADILENLEAQLKVPVAARIKVRMRPGFGVE